MIAAGPGRLERSPAAHYIAPHVFAALPDRRTHDLPREHDRRARRRRRHTVAHDLGDFSAGWRLVPMSVAGIAIGVLGALVALALLELIGLFTNLFFFGRWDTRMVSPAGNQLGLLEVAVPVAGALIVGLMARPSGGTVRSIGSCSTRSSTAPAAWSAW
jgi:hypothetical protein